MRELRSAMMHSRLSELLNSLFRRAAPKGQTALGVAKIKVTLNSPGSNRGQPKSQDSVPSKKVIPRRISQTTTSHNIENQLRPTLRRCGQYQRSLLDTKLAGRDSQAPYLPEPIFCSFPPNFPTVSSIGWQASIFHQELAGAHSRPLGVVHHPGV